MPLYLGDHAPDLFLGETALVVGDGVDSVAKIRPGGLFHFVQDHGRGFLVGKEEEVARRLLFGITAHEFLGLATVLHFDVGLATVVDNLEGEALNISPDPSERWYD